MKTLSRDEIEARIHDGDLLVIRHGYALKLNSWLEKHPGGDKAILHLVGKDGSDEIDVYHCKETLRKMNSFRVGRVELPFQNFRPPIQGGQFRSRQEIQNQKCKHVQSEPVSARDFNANIDEKHAEVIDANISAELKFDMEKYPSVDNETQKTIQNEFRELHIELEKAGYFKCNYWGYVREFSRISSLFGLAAVFFSLRKSIWALVLSAVCIGLGWHQLVFIAHDAGHLGISHNYYIDNLFGIFIADFIGGLSLGWWKRNHNVHHLVTNDPVHDPDIQHLPMFAVTSRLFGDIYSTYYDKTLWYDAIAKVFVKIQHHLYYPILCLGRFNLYRLSWEYVLLGLGPRKGKAAFLRYVEFVGLAAFNYWFFYLLCYKALHTTKERLIFILVSHIVTMPVHVQITLSHFAQSTSDLGTQESFAQRQVRTTMDVACPPWFDYVHGGLQFQTIHHLFPRMPRHNFRAVQPRVIEFCKSLGLHYTIYGFTRGNKKVIDRLYEVAQQAAVFNACSEFCRQELVGGETPLVDEAKRQVKLDKARAAVKTNAAVEKPLAPADPLKAKPLSVDPVSV